MVIIVRPVEDRISDHDTSPISTHEYNRFLSESECSFLQQILSYPTYATDEINSG